MTHLGETRLCLHGQNALEATGVPVVGDKNHRDRHTYKVANNTGREGRNIVYRLSPVRTSDEHGSVGHIHGAAHFEGGCQRRESERVRCRIYICVIFCAIRSRPFTSACEEYG